MNKLTRLIDEFGAVAARPWSDALAGRQRVWMVVYDETDELRLRARLGEFEQAAAAANHPMTWCDLTATFATWMAAQEYHEDYFEYPEDLLIEATPDTVIGEFLEAAARQVREALAESGPDGLVGLVGVGSLFGIVRASALIAKVEEQIEGRMAVFFPGSRNGNTYRLLDARDGWSYLALPIPA